MKFSVANELLGIVAHSEDILRDINQVDLVTNNQLVLWTWGENNELNIFLIANYFFNFRRRQ